MSPRSSLLSKPRSDPVSLLSTPERSRTQHRRRLKPQRSRQSPISTDKWERSTPSLPGQRPTPEKFQPRRRWWRASQPRPETVSGYRSCRAPRDFLMPISFVRSVTDTSMMFMITIAPTISAMPGTAIATMKMVPKSRSRRPVIASGVTMPKLSFSLGPSLRLHAHQEARLLDGVVEELVGF